jgi:hypothetical protein
LGKRVYGDTRPTKSGLQIPRVARALVVGRSDIDEHASPTVFEVVANDPLFDAE